MTEEYIDQTSLKKLPVIFGEKVVLIPFLDLFDMDPFIALHRSDKRGFMCRFCLKDLNDIEAEVYIENLIRQEGLAIWSVCLKGDQDKRLGFIYLSNVTSYSASINGIMEKSVIRSLPKEQRNQKLTFADDAAITLLNSCFDNGFQRIEGDAVEDDREAITLHKRIGFKQEGVLRRAVNINGKFLNLVIVSILREEWNHGKKGPELQSTPIA